MKGASGMAAAVPNETVDVIIPIYNSFDYVKRCIEAVLRNSESPYHLYLINDCSTDPRMKPYLDRLHRHAKSEHLTKLVVIHNEHNYGFVKNANLGMGMSFNHAILLNSDTVVPKNWIGRLISPILLDPGIASVSPFSNNAWICSFPSISNEGHELPEQMSVDEVDAIFRLYGSGEAIELPTAIGFCMAMNRNVIDRIGVFDDETYGKGYCEEGDWCFRAKTAGYKNVLIPNLYVYHKLGASFDLHSEKSRDERIEENVVKWANRYPELFAGIQVFLDDDPIRPIRSVLRSAVEARRPPRRKGLLVFVPEAENTDRAAYPYGTENRMYTMRMERGGLQLTDPYVEGGLDYLLSPDDLGRAECRALMRLFNIHAIRVSKSIRDDAVLEAIRHLFAV